MQKTMKMLLPLKKYEKAKHTVKAADAAAVVAPSPVRKAKKAGA